MSAIIYLLLSILSIYFYRRDRFPEMFLCLTMIMNNLFCFDLAIGTSSIKNSDFLILSMIAILAMEYFQDKDLFSVKDDIIGKIVLLCFGWTVIVFCGTIILGQDTPSFAFKMYRPFLVLPFYFIIRKMSMDEIEQYIKYVLWFSIIQGVFFYLQLVGINGILSGYFNNSGGNVRYGNYPDMAPFFFVYFLIKEDVPINKKIFFLIFFGMMPVIGQMRGAIMALALSCMIYFILQRRMKYVIYIAVAAIMYQFVLAPIFSKRADEKGIGTIQELSMIVKDPANAVRTYDNSGGNFAFRIAMYVERIEYLIDNPEYLLGGVGTVHEETARQKYNFRIGTVNSLDDGTIALSVLGSADIAWVGIIMHFGVIGVFLFTLLYFFWAKYGLKYARESTNDIFTACAVLSIGAYLLSYDGETIGRVSMMTTFFMLAVIVIYIRENENYLEDYG